MQMGQIVKSKWLIVLTVPMVVVIIVVCIRPSLLSRSQILRQTHPGNLTSISWRDSTIILVQNRSATTHHPSSVKIPLSSFLHVSNNDLKLAPRVTTLTPKLTLNITSSPLNKPTLPTARTIDRSLSPNGRKRWIPYMLALHVAEQLTMNTYHFIEFLNMVYQWNFTAVEPFVYRSRMFALRSMHWDDINGSVYYHQLLNTSFMKNKLWQCLRQQYGSGQGSSNSSQLFVPLREFLRTSIQRIALVYFPKHLYVLGKDIQIRTDSKLGRTAKEAIVDCTRVLRDSGMSGNVEMLLNQEFVIEKLHRDKYEVVQAFCIMPRVEVSLEQIKKNVLAHVHRDESGQINANVIFVSWQGRFTRPFTDMTTIQHCQLPTDKIPPSQEVASAAESFLDYLGLQKSSYIAVHIRFEKLFDFAFQDMRDPDLFLHCCMQKLDVVLKQLLNGCSNQTTPCKPLLLHDYGPYGSDSCHHNGTWKKREVCIGSVEHLLSMVKVTSPVGFDPIKFAAPKNAGFVSKVEAMSLTDGQSLIVIGGGSFQASVVNRFRAKRKNKLHDYRLCAKADEKFNGINLNDIDRQCVGT